MKKQMISFLRCYHHNHINEDGIPAHKRKIGKRKFLISILISVILLCFFCPLTVAAHSGKTDANGGHYDSNTGEYHYHHGYPAHQHTNGKCPYDYDDKTNHNSSSSSKSSNDRTYNNEPKSKSVWYIVKCVIGMIFLSPLIALFLMFMTFPLLYLPISLLLDKLNHEKINEAITRFFLNRKLFWFIALTIIVFSVNMYFVLR